MEHRKHHPIIHNKEFSIAASELLDSHGVLEKLTLNPDHENKYSKQRYFNIPHRQTVIQRGNK